MWQSLLDAEIAKYNSSADQDNLQSLQDWIITIANDQINCIADDDEDHPSYLAIFERAIIPEVSPEYTKVIDAQINNLRDGYLGLAIACIHAFVSLIFLTDFKPILGEWFTAHWYSQKRMSAITTTYKDYLQDYMKVVHPSLQEMLLTELSDELLVHYLSSVRNKGAKFRRADPFTGKIKEDVMTVFEFFNSYTDAVEVHDEQRRQFFKDAFNDIRNKWRAVNEFVRLLEADKSQVPFVYEEVKMQYPDMQISWVEAVLRSRDDFERSMLNAVKAKAAEITVESGLETIFSKVK